MRKKDFSEVQRYTNDYCGSVSLDVNGEYVKYEDYERLLRAYNELEEINKALVESWRKSKE